MTEFGRLAHGDDWKGEWSDPATGDRVVFHEDGLIGVDLAERCKDHAVTAFCPMCIKRLVAATEAARRCLDPEAPAVHVVAPDKGEMPEFIALYNPIANHAFALRRERSLKVCATKSIYTTRQAGDENLPGPVTLVDHTTETRICDSQYVRGFTVRLGDGIPEADAKRLWEAKFSLSIDGELVTRQTPLRDLIQQKEITLEYAKNCCLFPAHPFKENPKISEDARFPGVDLKTVDTSKFLGYMLPNGTKINATLADVPRGIGLVKIEVGWTYGSYTSKPKPATTEEG